MPHATHTIAIIRREKIVKGDFRISIVFLFSTLDVIPQVNPSEVEEIYFIHQSVLLKYL
jgi:hypothetical protein